jgi:hypothetical protein
MILNGRILAKYMLGTTRGLSFKLKPVKVKRSDTLHTKELILRKSCK